MWMLAALLVAAQARPVAETLPAVALHAHSFELLSNSRYSTHSGFTDSLPRQVLANVLWAMDRVPRLGAYREIYVATRDNVSLFDPATNTLTEHRAGDLRYNSGSAFEVGIAVERHEEAGMAVQAGLVAGTAFRDDGGSAVASCPMKWAQDHANLKWNPRHTIRMVSVYGQAEATPLDTAGAAISSDSSLTVPFARGQSGFEQVLSGLRQDSSFGLTGLSDENLSQLLWAAYGVTPHQTYRGRLGTTVPTAAAAFHLTGRIYLVRDVGLERYHNRRPGDTTLTTADHRLERVFSGDLRHQLRQATARIPGAAPAYIVVCVSDTGSNAAMLEAGFTAFQLLAQARSLGLAGFLSVPLSRIERRAIQAALGLPADHIPALVFSCGELASGLAEGAEQPGLVRIVRANPAIRQGRMRLEYWLGASGDVRVEVFDMLGRPVRLLLEERQSVGYHSVLWDGTGPRGQRLKRGTYLMVVFSHGAVAKHKVTLG
jgi:hypothetical protein